MSRILKKGQGWRIGWDPDASYYKGLVGSDQWAIELTEAEFKDFCRLLPQLTDTMKMMKEELMEEERIACELESELVWLEVEGLAEHYSLRLILHQDRRCEGNWTENSVKELAQATNYFRYL